VLTVSSLSAAADGHSPAAWPEVWEYRLPAHGPVDFRSYPDAAAVTTFVRRLCADHPDLARCRVIGQSVQGRDLLALYVGSGEGPAGSRPAVLVEAGSHAREAISVQVALFFAWWLLSEYGSDPLATHLVKTRDIIIVPLLNPDGYELFLFENVAQRRNACPVDDDGDGLADEDSAQGFGFAGGASEWWELEFDPEWVRRTPALFATGWQRHATGRHAGYRAAGEPVLPQDTDGDGQFWEDPVGGVDLNRNFAAGWQFASPDPASPLYRGVAPFSEPETRALRDLVLATPELLTAISLHSGADRIMMPGVWGEGRMPEAELYEEVGRKGSELTEWAGYAGSPHTFGYPGAPGEARSWFYEQGLLAWLFEVYRGPLIDVWFPLGGNRALASVNTGGLFNPPGGGIVAVAARWLRLLAYVAAATPRVYLTGAIRTGPWLVVGLGNDGAWPIEVEVAVAGRRVRATLDPGETAVALRSPPGEVWLSVSAGRLAGGQGGLKFVTAWRPAGGRMVCDQFLPPEPTLDPGPVYFGGWTADPARWDLPAYHLGPPFPERVCDRD
jgi:hypothetical protein